MRKIAVLLVPVLLAAACSNGPRITPGADVEAAGPHYSMPATTDVPQGQDAAGVPSAAPAMSPGPLEALRARIVTGLAHENAVAGATMTIEQRASAAGQLVFKWTASNDPGDEQAAAGLRAQALVILQQAKLSGLAYGSVLLIAGATVHDRTGRRTEVVAVRAKYTRGLVLRTDFTTVDPKTVFTLPDDKPAELDPHFS
ncbi:hypothetical protein [Dactylosporangium sp. NPDC051541]|uniref:hypothetical protein n=1 Tax=Dactylosporangium sp. NPDC051541 TaxID=3363977 RepID=UPI00379D5F71